MRCRFAPESLLQSGDCAIEIAGETLVLLPERALLWPERATVFVADVHLGKAATFRAKGIPVPEDVHAESLDRLTQLLERTRANRLIVLGDLWHSKFGMEPEPISAFRSWRQRHAEIEVCLVAGNHDRHSGPLPDDLAVTVYPEGKRIGPFGLHHEPDFSQEVHPQKPYVLSGHLHPMLRLEGGALGSERLRCFWVTPTCMVLPAFGEFTGGFNVDPDPSDRMAVIAGGRVISCSGSAFAE